MEKFSNSLPLFEGKIENPVLQDSLFSLEAIITNKLFIKDWGNERIAVSVEIKVELPSLGTYNDIDIREVEPVILVFNLTDYPLTAPMVFTDRTDFPKNELAHLYIENNERPSGFCYVRGDSNEWYANKRIHDLIIRIGNWLRDAATGELTENGQQFEPLRLEGYYSKIIYDYNNMLQIANGQNAFHFGENLAISVFESLDQAGRSVFKFVKALTADNTLNTINEINNEHSKNSEDTTRRNYHYAYILSNKEDVVNKDYFINLPKNWEEFKVFCSFYSLDYKELEKMITISDGNLFYHFPVIIGIRRPATIIGYSSNLEFLNFRFRIKMSEDVREGKIINNIPIDLLAHAQPLTSEKASAISGTNSINTQKHIIFGCGALGSKIIMHMARAGHSNLTLIDPDCISPHNLVRHVLFDDDIGQNKATAVASKIKQLYNFETEVTKSAPAFKDGFIDKESTFDIYNWILDFTASGAFFNKLVSLESINKKHIASASISDFGNLGILLKEGQARNPRIDDLQIFLFSQASNDKKIAGWLSREDLVKNENNLLINVGIGCNSETTILSDDKISSHAAYFSGVLKRQMTNPCNEGKIFLNRIKDDKEYTIETILHDVKPFVVVKAHNNSSWTIRFKDGVITKIKEQFYNSGEIETGGVFVGVCNYKTKTIHVTDSIDAPLDSKSDSTQFIRGIHGLPEEIEKIKDDTGGQLGYIGEWHSHPVGPNFLSKDDLASVNNHKNELSQVNPPLPVFLSILTPDGLFPFIF